jgi:release factor glutamine methyltransferase
MHTIPRLEYFGDTYRPSDDTWLLLDVFKAGSASGDLCVDLGCGSGVLGIYSLLNKKCKRVVFIDIQEDALMTTSFNTVLNGVEAFSIILQSDACRTLPLRERSVGIVLANPPYLPLQDEISRDITIESGVEGYEKVLCFTNMATSMLKPNGLLYLVYSSLSKPEIIQSHLEKLGFKIVSNRSRNFFFESLIAIEGVLNRED